MAANWSLDQDVRTVQLIKLSGTKSGALILPGDVQSWTNAPIYARVSGYPHMTKRGADLVFAWTESSGPETQQVKAAVGRLK